MYAGCERLLDPAKFFDGEQLYGQNDIALILRGGLVDRVREEFGFYSDEMRHHGFVCEHRSESIEFVLEISRNSRSSCRLSSG